jgi:hypothetical protein
LVLDHDPCTRRSIETQSRISPTGHLIIKGEIQIEDHRYCNVLKETSISEE